MGDTVLLPNGGVLIINGGGGAAGTAGWECGSIPVLNPVVYSPDGAPWTRFRIQNPTTIPRMYHSTAVLLRDDRVLVGGSSPYLFGGHSPFSRYALAYTKISYSIFCQQNTRKRFGVGYDGGAAIL